MQSTLGVIFGDAGVQEDQLHYIVAMLKENPMAALAEVQRLNLSPEVVQQVMSTVMMNPSAIEELALELGLGDGDIQMIKNQMQFNNNDAEEGRDD